MAKKSRIDAWSLMKILVVPCLFLCAIFKHPAFQWIAAGALALWVCFMLAEAIRPRIRKRKNPTVGQKQEAMDLIYDMEAPDLNTMVKRVMNVTGFTDEQEATKMAIVVRDVAERCRQTMITDGSCGMREFKSWVLSTMVTHDPYESALSTIISSASADPDNRAELISACLEPQYTRTI